MTIAAIKEKLHHFVEHGDKKKIKALYLLLESSIDEIALNASIQRGISDSEKGLGRPYKEFMTEVRKYKKG